jgi:hypothetical protein
LGLSGAKLPHENQTSTTRVNPSRETEFEMYHPVPEEKRTRRRFGFAEIAVVVAILAFGGFTLVADGRQTLGEIWAGLSETIAR